MISQLVGGISCLPWLAIDLDRPHLSIGCTTNMGNVLRKQNANLDGDDVDFLVNNTSLDESTIRERHDEFLKEFPDGVIGQENFIFTYKAFFPEKTNAEDFSRHMFRTFDRDKDGFISFREFMLATHVLSSDRLDDKLR